MHARIGVWNSIALAVLLSLGLAAPAHAATTMFTGPLVPPGDGQLDSYLVNVSNKTRDVVIEVLNKDGVALSSEPFVLAPGTEHVVVVPADQAPRYCKFIVEGARSNYRGSALTRQVNGGCISALPAE